MQMETTKHSRPCAPLHPRGITLLELLVTLSIGTSLLAVAIPAASGMLADNRITTKIYEFITQLNFARQAAVIMNQQITICKSDDGSSCDNNLEWEDGWIIFVDKSRDYKRSSDEPVLQMRQAKSHLTIRYKANLGLDNYVAFRPMGNSVGNGTFTFCSNDKQVAPRGVVLHRTGKVRLSREYPDGDPLTCPE